MKTSKISKILTVTVLAMISVVVNSAYGAFSVTRNGVTWAATYEGDVQPQNSSPAWAGYGGGGSASGSSDGTVWTQTTVTNSYQYFEQTDPTWTSTGSQKTIEFRARVLAQTAGDDAFRVWAADANGYWEISLLSNAVYLVGSSTIGFAIPVDNSTFHTYRLTIDESVSVNQAKLYIDNNSTPIVTSGGFAPGATIGNFIMFGDDSESGIGGTTAMDFISWTSGVFPPTGSATTTNTAYPAVIRNGVAWNASYGGGVNPSDSTPTWTGFTAGNNPGSGASDGTNWTQTTTTSSFLYFDLADSSWASIGFQKTIEFRAQVLAQTSSDRAFDMFAIDTNGAWRVSLSSNGVQLVGSSAVGPVVPVNNSTFHTYRLTIDDNLSVNQAKLYLDNNPTPIQTSGANAPSFGIENLLAFGDDSESGVGGTISLNYVSWTGGVFPAGTVISGVPTTIAQGSGISWLASNGITYQVQFTTNVATNAVWTNFGGPIIGNGKTNMVFDAFGNINSKFYRVIIPQ